MDFINVLKLQKSLLLYNLSMMTYHMLHENFANDIIIIVYYKKSSQVNDYLAKVFLKTQKDTGNK